jgi:hypothetical protein
MALGNLILVLHHDRKASSLAIAAIHHHKNEQDPVRKEMLSALAKISSARIADHLIPEVVGIIEDVLEDADLSNSLTWHATKLFPMIL